MINNSIEKDEKHKNALKEAIFNDPSLFLWA